MTTWFILLASISSHLTVQDLCISSSVCSQWHHFYETHCEWITKYRELPFLNPTHTLLSLMLGDVKTETQRRTRMITNIQNNTFEQIESKGLQEALCVNEHFVIHSGYHGFFVYNIKTQAATTVPFPAEFQGDSARMVAECDAYYMVILFFKSFPGIQSPLLAVYDWKGIFRGSVSPIRDTVLPPAIVGYSSLCFSSKQSGQILVQYKKDHWSFFKFKNLKFLAERNLHKEFSTCPAMKMDMLDNILVTVHPSRETVDRYQKRWRLQGSNLCCRETMQIEMKLFDYYHFSEKYCAVMFYDKVNVLDRTTDTIVCSLHRPGATLSKFCANSSVGLLALVFQIYRTYILCLFDIRTKKEVFNGEFNDSYLDKWFSMTNNGIVYVSTNRCISWDFSKPKV